MNQYQLSYLDTETLKTLQRDIRTELQSRSKRNSVDLRRSFLRSLKPQLFESQDDVVAYNSSRCLRPPYFDNGTEGSRINNLSRYLPALIAQDWSSCYPKNEGDKNNEFYVYAHVDPRRSCFVAPAGAPGGNYGGLPFYIGKGTGKRAYDLKRNQAHGKRISSILQDGFEPSDIVHIVVDRLTEQEALLLEAKLIFFFGTEYEKKKGYLVNLDIPRHPPCGESDYMSRLKTRKHWMADWSKQSAEAEK